MSESDLMQLLDEGMLFKGEWKKIDFITVFNSLKDLVQKNFSDFSMFLDFDIGSAINNLEKDLSPNFLHSLEFLNNYSLEDSILSETSGDLNQAFYDDWTKFKLTAFSNFISLKDGSLLNDNASVLFQYFATVKNYFDPFKANVEMFTETIEKQNILTFFINDKGMPLVAYTNKLDEISNTYFINLSEDKQQEFMEMVEQYRKNFFGSRRGKGDFA